VGEGWLIFDLPEADMGCHPADESHGAPSGTPDISFYFDDIVGTAAELKEKGVTFKGDIADHGCGLVTFFQVSGDFWVQLYQPPVPKVVAVYRTLQGRGSKFEVRSLLRLQASLGGRRKFMPAGFSFYSFSNLSIDYNKSACRLLMLPYCSLFFTSCYKPISTF